MDNFHPRWWRIPFAQMTFVTQRGTFLANKTVFIGLTQRRAADIETIGCDDQQIYFLAIGAPVSDPPTHDKTKKLIFKRDSRHTSACNKKACQVARDLTQL
jgi:hypothetical protein